MVEDCLKLMDLGYYELKIAFEGLEDAHVWKRPAPALLSVGELAGHIAFWEAMRLAGDSPDLTRSRVSSPLIDQRFRYYSTTLETAPAEEHRALSAEQVCAELLRVHAETVAHFRERNPDPDSRIPGCPAEFTYREYLQYAVFHLGYHTGQIYSVRHLLGETTPNN